MRRGAEIKETLGEDQGRRRRAGSSSTDSAQRDEQVEHGQRRPDTLAAGSAAGASARRCSGDCCAPSKRGRGRLPQTLADAEKLLIASGSESNVSNTVSNLVIASRSEIRLVRLRSFRLPP